MNVLQVLPNLGSGGVERTTLEISHALLAAGHGAQVASAGGPLVPLIRGAGGVCHTLPMASKNPFMWRLTAAVLSAIIRDQKIDIVHVRSRAPAFPARWAVLRAQKRGHEVKLVTTYHGIYSAKSKLKRRYNAVMTKADAVIANSDYTAAHIMAEHGLSAEAIDTIPRGVDLSRFPLEISNTRIADIRAHWGVSDDTRVLLLPGRLTRLKGHAEAIAAMAQISGLCLVIQGDAAGRDNYARELEALAAKLPAGRVRFASAHDDMAAAYAASFGVLTVSQKPESFGRVTAEACAMGRPVIATHHGGYVEILDGGTMGLMAEPGSVESLTTQIRRLAAMSAEQATAFAAPAQARARSIYTLEAMCAATLAVYARLHAQKRY